VDEARTLLTELRADGAPRHAIKDPRFSFLLPFWEALAPADRVVVPLRHPLGVAQSLRRRNKMPITLGVDLWRRYTLAAVDAHDDPLVVDYNRLITDTHATAVRLSRELGLPHPDDATLGRISDFVEPDLDHLDDEVGLDSPELERALELYDRLRV
jgi:hypothetical protein